MNPLPEILPRDVHNETLMSNVHPADWTNPTPSGKYTWHGGPCRYVRLNSRHSGL